MCGAPLPRSPTQRSRPSSAVGPLVDRHRLGAPLDLAEFLSADDRPAGRDSAGEWQFVNAQVFEFALVIGPASSEMPCRPESGYLLNL